MMSVWFKMRGCFTLLINLIQAEHVALEFDSGTLTIRDQIREYMDRGQPLEELSYLEFFRNSYDIRVSSNYEGGDEDNVHRRACLPRFQYLSGTGHECHRRVLRREGHEMMVTFSGPWFPRADDASNRTLYCASVLALLKPWCRMNDLKEPETSFEDALQEFLSDAPASVHRILDNIQYFYDCADKVIERSEVTLQDISDTGQEMNHDDELAEENVEEDPLVVPKKPILRQSAREILYADIAMNVANEFKIFDDSLTEQEISWSAPRATKNDIDRQEEWLHAIDTAERSIGGTFDSESGGDVGRISIGTDHTGSSSASVFSRDPLDSEMTEDIEDTLNEEQAIAFTILKNHLRGLAPKIGDKQLLMIITGPGGTGKTKILQALIKDLRKSGMYCFLYNIRFTK